MRIRFEMVEIYRIVNVFRDCSGHDPKNWQIIEHLKRQNATISNATTATYTYTSIPSERLDCVYSRPDDNSIQV